MDYNYKCRFILLILKYSKDWLNSWPLRYRTPGYQIASHSWKLTCTPLLTDFTGKRETNSIPNINTGPHAASSKAKWCDPSGVGVARFVTTSTNVEMQARNWTKMNALDTRNCEHYGNTKRDNFSHNWNKIICQREGERSGGSLRGFR